MWTRRRPRMRTCARGGLEVWGNLTLCGADSLRATGSQCGVFALGALVIDGCLVDGRADGRGMIDASVAGVRGATVSVRGGAHVVAAGSGSGDDCHFLGMYASDGQFAVDASWVDATGAKAGVACESGSLTSALFVTPMGGAFGRTSVIDANGSVTQHVVIEPTGANPPAGETRPGTDESAGGDPRGIQSPVAKKNPRTRTSPARISCLCPIRLLGRTKSRCLLPPRRLRPRLPRRPSPHRHRPPLSPKPATAIG